ncbi:MAG: hypothetical protein Q9204_003829 [Flavoplaca sp. TL-2023a]
MDAAATAAGWLSFFVTAVGLGSLITQASAIEEQLDPFLNSRSREFLGSWFALQPSSPWYKIKKSRPTGPVIFARLTDGFCGFNAIDVTRIPAERSGKASWTAALAIIHKPGARSFYSVQSKEPNTFPAAQNERWDFDSIDTSKIDPEREKAPCLAQQEWASLATQPLTRHGSTTCIVISRTTLVTMLILVNGRQMFRYSDASGHRASYASYGGHFYINWPLDGAATVYFAPHDSHNRSTDVYPASFPVRVDKCIQMVAGIVTSPTSSFQCAFAGRKQPGMWILEYQRKGFPGAHGSRHLWNLMGGKVYEVDFLLARRLKDGDGPPDDSVVLQLPSKEVQQDLVLRVPKAEEEILLQALDCLPWSSMSWSVHRGLRDILVTYAKRTMDQYRKSLAAELKSAVSDHSPTLVKIGWNPVFVYSSMGDIAANSVMAGEGNSGDSVRVVTAAALLLWDSQPRSGLDETRFWRERKHAGGGNEGRLEADAVIALTKVFVLEWSIDFDYQMYHDLPPELLFR